MFKCHSGSSTIMCANRYDFPVVYVESPCHQVKQHNTV